MTVKPETLKSVKEAHALGWLDPDIARYAGVSISTVKRARTELGLETHSVTVQRGKLGERLVAQAAQERGLQLQWRERENGPYDLTIAGQRVDVKATLMRPDGSLRFRCPNQRTSFFGQYEYSKVLSQDCDVVALVGLTTDQKLACAYFLPSTLMPQDLKLKPGDQH